MRSMKSGRASWMPPVRGDGSLRAIKLENERRAQEVEDMMRVQKEWTGASDFQLRPKDAELANGEFFSRDIEVSVEVVTSEVQSEETPMTRDEGEAPTDASLSSPVYRVTITGVMGQSSVGCTRRFGSFRALKKYMGVRSADELFPEGVGSVLRKVGIKLNENQLQTRATRLQAWLQHLLANSGSQLSHWQAEALAQFLHMELISKPSSDPASPKLTAQPTPAFLPRSQRAYSSSPPCMLNDTFSLKEVKEVDARADSTGAGAGTGGGLALRVVAAPAARRSSLTPEAA